MRRVSAGAAFVLFFLLAAGAPAAEPARVTLALVGGRIVDGYEGRPIEDGVILVAGERIAPWARGPVACLPEFRRSTRAA